MLEGNSDQKRVVHCRPRRTLGPQDGKLSVDPIPLAEKALEVDDVAV